MPRAIWKGSISFGLVNIPVKLYTAVKDRALELHYLHSKCHTKLEYKKWCPKCKREVEWNEVEEGYKIGRKFIPIKKEELKKLKLKTAKIIEILGFTDASQIDTLYFRKAYYVVPQDGGERAYYLFRQVLELTGKVAIGRVIIRNRERIVVIKPYRHALVLITLAYKDEIVPIENLKELESVARLREQELKLARALIEKLSFDFDISKFKDRYVENLTKLIKGKLKIVEEKEKKEEPKDILEALKLSIKVAKKAK